MTWVSISLLLTSNSTLFQLYFLWMCLVHFSGSSDWADVYIWYISQQTSLFLFLSSNSETWKETEWDTIFLQCLNYNVSNINESRNSWRKVIPGNRSMAGSCYECVIFSLHKKFYWLKKWSVFLTTFSSFSSFFQNFYSLFSSIFPQFRSIIQCVGIQDRSNQNHFIKSVFKWQINMPRFH